MKCYFHTDCDAVSTCPECSKSLCKGCYDQGQNGICSTCVSSNQIKVKKEKQEDHLNYMKRSIICLTVGLFFGFQFAYGPISASNVQINQTVLLIIALLYGYLGFSIYWGLKVLSSLLKKMLNSGIFILFIWPLFLLFFVVAGLIGMYISIPMFFSHYKQYKKLKNNTLDIER